MDKNKEIRKIYVDTVETRALEDGKNVIEGYITKFNTLSQYMGFFETVSPNAFDKTLADGHNVYAMYNHDDSKILGSTKTGSLLLETDNIGLKFSLTINPNVSYANDTLELVKSGDIDGCSFGFICNQDDWSIAEDGTERRILLDVTLIECTITPFPAYLDSEASCRSYDKYKQSINQEKELEELRKILVLQEIENQIL